MATNHHGLTKHPYERIENLREYIIDRSAHQEAGWVNGRVHLRGKYYTEQEFREIFPCELKYKITQLDSRQTEK